MCGGHVNLLGLDACGGEFMGDERPGEDQWSLSSEGELASAYDKAIYLAMLCLGFLWTAYHMGMFHHIKVL